MRELVLNTDILLNFFAEEIITNKLEHYCYTEQYLLTISNNLYEKRKKNILKRGDDDRSLDKNRLTKAMKMLICKRYAELQHNPDFDKLKEESPHNEVEAPERNPEATVAKWRKQNHQPLEHQHHHSMHYTSKAFREMLRLYSNNLDDSRS